MSKQQRTFYENEIKELHNSILEISKSCFEYKKLCITTIGIFLGLILNSIGKHDLFTLENTILASISVTFLITLIFHTADSISYYFQRANRKRQDIYKNLLNIKDKTILNKITTMSYYNSMANQSMIIYALIYIILITTSITIHYRYNLQSFLVLTSIIYFLLLLLLVIAKIYDKSSAKPKIFICYTTRDKEIINNKSLLLLKKSCNRYKLNTYIDIIDNNQLNIQDNVYLHLFSSDVLVVLKTHCFDQSFWAKHELKIAQALGINIISIPISCNDQLPMHRAIIKNILYH